LAEWLCRTVDRIDPARVLGPRYCFGRGTSTPDSKIIRRLLQLRQNALIFAQGCADFSSDSSDRKRSFTPDPWWTSLPLLPNLGFRYTQALNLSHIPAAFVVQYATGVVLQDWTPRAGHYPEIAYRIAFAVNPALQIAAWVWFSFPRIKHYLS